MIKYFACKFGCQKKDIDSLLQETNFSRKLFMVNKKEDLILYPNFTNILQKLKKELTLKIKIKYPKQYIKFNQNQANFLESETKTLIQILFKRRYYNNIFLDGIHEVDGLIKFKDSLTLNSFIYISLNYFSTFLFF